MPRPRVPTRKAIATGRVLPRKRYEVPIFDKYEHYKELHLVPTKDN
jgi:hypothetical protein